MKKLFLFFILFLALFLFSSCGLPNVYVPSSSDINITVNGSSNKVSVDISDTTFNELHNSTATLYLFYTVSSESQSSNFNSLISSFNSSYCSNTNGMIISQSQPTDSFFTYKSSNEEYRIYQPIGVSFELDSKSNDFTFTYNSSNNTFELRDEDDNLVKSFYRYNGNNFSSSINDYNDERTGTEETSYKITFYFLVSCNFSLYTNTFNTELSSSDSLEFEFSSFLS